MHTLPPLKPKAPSAMAMSLKSMPLKSTALQRGLTLVELVAVLAIIGVLTSISVPMYSDYITRSKVLAAYEILTDKQKELINYLNDNGTIQNASACGTTINTLSVLSKTADWTIRCVPTSSTTWVLSAQGASPALKDSSGGNAVFIYLVMGDRFFNGYSIGWMGPADILVPGSSAPITGAMNCWPTNKNQTTCPSGS